MTPESWTLNLVQDPDSNQWTGWFTEFPGAVAQGTREEIEGILLNMLSDIFKWMAERPEKRDLYTVNEIVNY